MSSSKPGLLVISEKNIENLKELLTSAKDLPIEILYVSLNSDVQRTDELISKIYLISANVCPKIDIRLLVKSEIPSDYRLIGDENPLAEKDKLPLKKYKKVVLGGTFDRLHNGHKVLLNKASELAEDEIVIGVTDKDMIIKKSLFEMIEPVEFRMQKVVDFVEDISGTAKCITEPITDPYGPSTRIADLEAIIVSQETVKGGDAVNKKRIENGMKPLDTVIVELVEGADLILNETKISSSSRRRQDLGRLLKAPIQTRGYPYFIGLNGGISSGMDGIGTYLNEKYGFEVVDLDSLGSDDKLRILEKTTEKKVIVLKSASLTPIESTARISEIWSVFVPPVEAARRIIQRDGITEEEVKERISTEISNKERIDKSHVVFCSLWNQNETMGQVDRAVEELMKRI